MPWLTFTASDNTCEYEIDASAASPFAVAFTGRTILPVSALRASRFAWLKRSASNPAQKGSV
jgi:hypothetical protein